MEITKEILESILDAYSYEAWHIRYVGKDLAQKIEKSGLTFDEYYARNY